MVVLRVLLAFFHAWQILVFHMLVAKQLTAALWKSNSMIYSVFGAKINDKYT